MHSQHRFLFTGVLRLAAVLGEVFGPSNRWTLVFVRTVFMPLKPFLIFNEEK